MNKFLTFGLFFSLFVACTKPTPRAPITVKKSTLFQETVKGLKQINLQEEQRILDFIKQDSLHKYQSSSKGYWYSEIESLEEELQTPEKGDQVTFKYEISDLNGTVIYSETELGVTTYHVDQEDIIPALQSGIKLMKIGETFTFVIPSLQAYGLVGDGNKIGVNQSIIINLTLINIKKSNEN